MLQKVIDFLHGNILIIPFMVIHTANYIYKLDGGICHWINSRDNALFSFDFVKHKNNQAENGEVISPFQFWMCKENPQNICCLIFLSRKVFIENNGFAVLKVT